SLLDEVRFILPSTGTVVLLMAGTVVLPAAGTVVLPAAGTVVLPAAEPVILFTAETAVAGTGIGVLPAIVEIAPLVVEVAIDVGAVARLGLVTPRIPRQRVQRIALAFGIALVS